MSIQSRFIAFLVFSFTLFLNSAFAAPEGAPAYMIDYSLPSTMQTRVLNNEQDVGGYVKTYIVQGAGILSINYGKNIKASLKDSMQQVINVMAKTNCKVRDTKILKEEPTMLMFSTTMDQCANGKSLRQIFKVFNMPDGQYSILYATEPKVVSADAVKKMEEVIQSAKIVPNK